MKYAVLRYLLGLLVSGAAAVSAGEEPWYVTKFGDRLVNHAGVSTPPRPILEGKTVGVYFAAAWSIDCRSFTPRLVKFYRAVAKRYNFEIVLVSCDKSGEEMSEHMNKEPYAPWCAVPFDSPLRAALMKEFNVRGIPRLVIFDKDGKLISNSALWDVSILEERAILRWRSPNYKPLTHLDAQRRSGRKNSKKSSKKHSR